MERRFFVKTVRGVQCRKYIEIGDDGVVKEIKETPTGEVLEKIYTLRSRMGIDPSSISPPPEKRTWKQKLSPNYIGNVINNFLQDDSLTR